MSAIVVYWCRVIYFIQCISINVAYRYCKTHSIATRGANPSKILAFVMYDYIAEMEMKNLVCSGLRDCQNVTDRNTEIHSMTRSNKILCGDFCLLGTGQSLKQSYMICIFSMQLKKKQSSREAIPDVSGLDFSSDSKTPDGKGWNKKFASWNINGIRAWIEVKFQGCFYPVSSIDLTNTNLNQAQTTWFGPRKPILTYSSSISRTTGLLDW